jgi:hypothetical protein
MSSDPTKYFIGKGIVSFKPVGGAYRDVGNCPTFEFTPKVETKDHFSSRTGIKTRDLRLVMSKSGTLKIVLEEWTLANLAIALMDDGYTTGDIDILSGTTVTGAWKMVGTNEQGDQYTVEFYNVAVEPTGNLGFIQDDFGQIELTGEVSIDPGTGSFGRVTAGGTA